MSRISNSAAVSSRIPRPIGCSGLSATLPLVAGACALAGLMSAGVTHARADGMVAPTAVPVYLEGVHRVQAGGNASKTKLSSAFYSELASSLQRMGFSDAQISALRARIESMESTGELKAMSASNASLQNFVKSAIPGYDAANSGFKSIRTGPSTGTGGTQATNPLGTDSAARSRNPLDQTGPKGGMMDNTGQAADSCEACTGQKGTMGGGGGGQNTPEKDFNTPSGFNIKIYGDGSYSISKDGKTEFGNSAGKIVDQNNRPITPNPDGEAQQARVTAAQAAATVKAANAKRGSNKTPTGESTGSSTAGGMRSDVGTGPRALFTEGKSGTYISLSEVSETLRVLLSRFGGSGLTR